MLEGYFFITSILFQAMYLLFPSYLAASSYFRVFRNENEVEEGWLYGFPADRTAHGGN